MDDPIIADMKKAMGYILKNRHPGASNRAVHHGIHEIVRLRALVDQLAAALRDAHGTATRHAVCWCSTDSEYPSDCDSTIALAAYEEARRG